MEDHPNAPGSDDRNPSQRFAELEALDNIRNEGGQSLVAPMNSPAERIFGAQPVAVKRRVPEIMSTLKALASAAGSEWYYRFPVNKKQRDGSRKQEWIEGPSIKLANDLARSYGNCDVDVRVVLQGNRWIFYARFLDIETGYSLTRPFQQRMGQSSMRTSSDRQEDIAFQIGASKAIRNVVCNALQTFADYAFQEAKNSLVNEIGKDLPKWRDRVKKGLERDKVDQHRVEKEFGRAIADWDAADVARLVAIGKAVSDGITTWDESFPPEGGQQASGGSPLSDDEGETEPKAETKTAAAEKKEPEPARDEKQAEPAAKEANTAPVASSGPPKTREDYLVHAVSWIEACTSAAQVDQKWKEERDIRPSVGLTEDDLDDLKEAREKRKKALKATA